MRGETAMLVISFAFLFILSFALSLFPSLTLDRTFQKILLDMIYVYY